MGSAGVNQATKRAAAIVAVMVGAGLSACGSSGSQGLPATAADGDVIESTNALGPGSWTGARTTDDGGLRIILAAAPEFSPGNPCTAEYVGSAAETESQVRVTITARSPRASVYGCEGRAYHRVVDIPLRDPLGTRDLIREPAGTVQEIFDASEMLEPASLPEGWSPGAEVPWNFDAGLGHGWQQNWGAYRDEGASSCPSEVEAVSLIQGPADITTFYSSKGELVGQFDVRGHQANLFSGGLAADKALVWTEGDRGYVLMTHASCAVDAQTAAETLTQFANSLV